MKNIIGVALALLAGSVQADVTVGGKVGLLGFGLEAAVPLKENIYLRGGMSKGEIFFEGKGSQSDSGAIVSDRGKLSFDTSYAMLDLHPFGTGFHVSMGIVTNKTLLQSNSVVDDPETEGVDLTSSVTVTYPERGQYFALGYNAIKVRGVKFSCEVGYIMQGSPQVDVDVTGSSYQGRLKRDIDRQVEKAKESLSQYDKFPVFSVGLTYNF